MCDKIGMSNDLTARILQRIRERLEEIRPARGWPQFGEVRLIATFHQGELVKIEGAVSSVSKNGKT
jgi:hypothetical protein